MGYVLLIYHTHQTITLLETNISLTKALLKIMLVPWRASYTYYCLHGWFVICFDHIFTHLQIHEFLGQGYSYQRAMLPYWSKWSHLWKSKAPRSDGFRPFNAGSERLRQRDGLWEDDDQRQQRQQQRQQQQQQQQQQQVHIMWWKPKKQRSLEHDVIEMYPTQPVYFQKKRVYLQWNSKNLS